jgi:uncharacterized membrane protein YdbT with pleckstrin-like domain
MPETKEEKKIEQQKKEISRLRQELRNFRKETKKQTVALITSAMGFVAALFWREAIQSFLEQVLKIKAGEGMWLAQFGVALIVTFIAVIILYSISRSS